MGRQFNQQTCPFLVEFYGAYLQEGCVNVIIEYMDRGSLRDIMTKTRQKNYKFKESELALIAIQILNGLSYLHIVAKQAHLDIKPENILINSDGLLKLTDFGISKDFSTSQDFMKTFLGTLQYMSPERMEVKSSIILTNFFKLTKKIE